MKKFIAAAVAASMLTAPAIASAAPRHNDNGRAHATQTVKYRTPQRTVTVKRTYRAPVVQQRNWQRGQRFDSRYARNYRQIDYRMYRNRGVYAAPRGYHWVQSGNDAVLVGVASGLIAAVIANAIN